MKRASEKVYISRKEIEIYQREKTRFRRQQRQQEEVKAGDKDDYEDEISAEEVDSDDLGDEISQKRRPIASQVYTPIYQQIIHQP